MSAVPAQFVQAGVVGRPFAQGHDPRRSVGRLSRAELEFRAALEEKHIPKASAALERMYEKGMEALEAGDLVGGEKLLMAFFKICGLIKKPADDAAIAEMAKSIIGEMLAAARARVDPGRDPSTG